MQTAACYRLLGELREAVEVYEHGVSEPLLQQDKKAYSTLGSQDGRSAKQ
jgi:hypothetical protein